MFLAIFSLLKWLLFPSFCAACKSFDIDQNEILCGTCSAKIRPVVSHQLKVTEHKTVTVHAVGAYDWPLVPLILAKSNRKRTVASQLGLLIWQRSVISHVPFECIIPIPLHWTRYAWRGYNQADEIARVIAQQSNVPLRRIVSRGKRTPFQSYFKGEARGKNVEDAFYLIPLKNRSFFKEKHLLIVDDVMTSGATIKYVAKELFKLHPASITAVVVSRVG